MIVSRHQTGITSPTMYTKDIHALGAEVITGHVIFTGAGSTDVSLDGSIDGINWKLLAATPISAPGYYVINYFPDEPTSQGLFRIYRLNFAFWGGAPSTAETWIAAQGHGASDATDTPLVK